MVGSSTKTGSLHAFCKNRELEAEDGSQSPNTLVAGEVQRAQAEGFSGLEILHAIVHEQRQRMRDTKPLETHPVGHWIKFASADLTRHDDNVKPPETVDATTDTARVCTRLAGYSGGRRQAGYTAKSAHHCFQSLSFYSFESFEE